MNLLDKIRCLHRHNIDEHPACFASGNVIDKRVNPKLPWYQEPGIKIGYLDIETDGLKADFGTMLSWAIKEKDGPTITDVITKQELFDGLADRRLVDSIINEMRKYKIIVTYYGLGFDLPFLRSKALHYGLDFPSYGEIYSFDLYYTVRGKLNLSRKSLDNVCDYLHIKGKTPIDKEVWRQAKYGEPEALREVVAHNVGDVCITEALHNRIDFTAKWTRRSI